ncbi:MAG: DUF4124 domain-containing protein [Gammaproteobacteria bacterium]|nr:DUF4124 domain-containing protein [Gammaproteobacteria bacterium]MDH3552189.1 DUF4124 domain-containing protein [Gammaproteobacteria bacterium]
METRPIFALIGLLAAASVFAQAYRWVDEDGVTHYSDRPQEGAEEVQLSEYSRKTGARLYTQSTPTRQDDDQQADGLPFRYESISVASPASEETLWNIEGVLNVSVALSPGLQSGHQVRVYFDGQARIVSGTSFQIEEVWRGAHNLQAEVIDATGKLMIRSQPIRFYVQQSSIVTRRP